jgi:hypothetical protein
MHGQHAALICTEQGEHSSKQTPLEEPNPLAAKLIQPQVSGCVFNFLLFPVCLVSEERPRPCTS